MIIEPKKTVSIALCLFFAIFLAVGCLVIVQTTKRAARNYSLVHSGMKGSGKVIDYKQTSGKSGRIWPVVSFVASDGRPVTFESLYHPRYSGYSMGQSVRVVYDMKNPAIAEIDEPERLWGGLTFSYFVGGVFVMFGGMAIVFILKRGSAITNR